MRPDCVHCDIEPGLCNRHAEQFDRLREDFDDLQATT